MSGCLQWSPFVVEMISELGGELLDSSPELTGTADPPRIRPRIRRNCSRLNGKFYNSKKCHNLTEP